MGPESLASAGAGVLGHVQTPIPYNTNFRKILVSVKFVSAILGPEMAVPILWAPGKMRSFCRKTYVHKILVLRGGGVFWVWGGGGKCRFYFYGRGDFSKNFVCDETLERVHEMVSQTFRPEIGSG